LGREAQARRLAEAVAGIDGLGSVKELIRLSAPGWPVT
jgi:hypothetical protein